MKPSDCYKFHGCNAPICPLEPELGVYLQHEGAVCYVARLAAKGAVPEKHLDLAAAVARGLPRLLERVPRLARALDKAAQTPAKALPGGCVP